MQQTRTATVVAGEFVPAGDPYREDKEDEPRPAGIYLTLWLDDANSAMVGGKVELTFLPRSDSNT